MPPPDEPNGLNPFFLIKKKLIMGKKINDVNYFFLIDLKKKWDLPEATPQRPESDAVPMKSEAGEHKGSTTRVVPCPPTLPLLLGPDAPLPALPEPNDAINPPTPPPPPEPPLLLPVDRKTLLVFLRFFHLARRFWNQTLKKKK
jgi:hypothetical protein